MIRRFICHRGKIDLWISVGRSWRAVDSSKTWGWVTLGCLWERSSSLLPSSLSFTARSFRRTAIFSSAVSSYILFQWPCFAFIFVFYFLCRSFFWLSRDLSHVASVRLLKTLQATKICGGHHKRIMWPRRWCEWKKWNVWFFNFSPVSCKFSFCYKLQFRLELLFYWDFVSIISFLFRSSKSKNFFILKWWKPQNVVFNLKWAELLLVFRWWNTNKMVHFNIGGCLYMRCSVWQG